MRPRIASISDGGHVSGAVQDSGMGARRGGAAGCRADKAEMTAGSSASCSPEEVRRVTAREAAPSQRRDRMAATVWGSSGDGADWDTGARGRFRGGREGRSAERRATREVIGSPRQATQPALRASRWRTRVVGRHVSALPAPAVGGGVGGRAMSRCGGAGTHQRARRGCGQKYSRTKVGRGD